MSIHAYFPSEQTVYNINRIYESWYTNPNGKLKWSSKTENKLTEDDFFALLNGSMVELEVPPDQEIPTGERFPSQFKHFLVDTKSTLFTKGNCEIEYKPDENSAIITIMSINAGKKYGDIHGVWDDQNKLTVVQSSGRPRHRSIFRQRRLKRTAAKSRCATCRATFRQRKPKSHCPPGRRHDTRSR
jgi:hypothetical protein